MRRAVAGLVVLAVAAAGLAGSGAVAAEPGDAAQVWTDQRMRGAQEADDLGALGRLDAAAARAGFAPAAARVAPPPAVGRARTWPATGRVARAVGRVFFTLGGRDYSCTGVAVRSANRSTVITAGHCVHDGPGRYASNWVFVPGYRAGARPYGTWRARALVAPPGWRSSGRMQDDVGYAVVAPLNGRRLTDVVGSVPVGFHGPRGAYVWAFGYPAAAPNAGRRAQFCRGTVRQDRWGTGAQGLACSMGQGASGGPWLSGFSAARGTGTVYAVTSFTYRGMAGVVWAPYLGRSAESLYRAVQRR